MIATLLSVMVAATLVGSAHESPATAHRTLAQRQVMVCGQSGGVNNGIYVASCLPGMKLLRPTSLEDAKPLVLADGTFVHEFVFEAPKVESWETTLCGADLLDFNIAGLSGASVSMKKLDGARADCVTKQFVNVSGVFSLVIHTAGPHPNIEMRTVYIPVNPSVLAHYTPVEVFAPVDAIPYAAYVPVMVPPPPLMSLPVMEGSAHGEAGVLPSVGAGVDAIPSIVAH
jgi:hypothetical protein